VDRRSFIRGGIAALTLGLISTVKGNTLTDLTPDERFKAALEDICISIQRYVQATNTKSDKYLISIHRNISYSDLTVTSSFEVKGLPTFSSLLKFGRVNNMDFIPKTVNVNFENFNEDYIIFRSSDYRRATEFGTSLNKIPFVFDIRYNISERRIKLISSLYELEGDFRTSGRDIININGVLIIK
jgi:hypothetical protein